MDESLEAGEKEDEKEDIACADRKKKTVNRKKLQDFDYLLQHFYQVDNTTTIGSDKLDAQKLLSYDLTVDTRWTAPRF